MFIFLWILGSIGVAYAARLNQRHPFWWFVVAVIVSPLFGSVLLWAANHWKIRLIRPT